MNTDVIFYGITMLRIDAREFALNGQSAEARRCEEAAAKIEQMVNEKTSRKGAEAQGKGDQP